MKICIVAPVHLYSDIRVFQKQARSLSDMGHEVIQFSRTPNNKIIVEQGVTIQPVKYKSRLSRFLKLIPLFFRVLQEKPDIVHLHNPDMIPFIFGFKVFGIKVIYDTHEDFSKKILLRGWIPIVLRKPIALIVDNLEKLGSWIADATIVTQSAQVGKFSNCFCIGNAPLFKEYQSSSLVNATRVPQGSAQTLTLSYLGGISQDRGLEFMLEILREFNLRMSTRLILIGNSINDDSLTRAQSREEWKYVDYHGPLAQDQAFALVQQSDFGLVTLLDVADYSETSPNKIYEYMMLGVPFIATKFPNWFHQLDSVQAGVFCNTEKLELSLIEEVIKIKKNQQNHQKMAKNGQKFIKNEFNWAVSELPTLRSCYDSLKIN